MYSSGDLERKPGCAQLFMPTFCLPSVSDIQPFRKKWIYCNGSLGHLCGINIHTAKYTAGALMHARAQKRIYEQ